MDEPIQDSPASSYGSAHPTTDAASASPLAGDFVGLPTHEDLDRASDRWRVSRARWRERKSRTFGGLSVLWLLVGPGGLVFLGENDAPSMLSYSATGARFGIGFFIPFVALTFVIGFVVQEMTVRLGAASGREQAGDSVADSCGHRSDGYSVDAFLPAKRGGR